MKSISRGGMAAVLFAVLILTVGACTTAEESKRKAAQANAEKYMEFIKAGDYSGAYSSTFHQRFQNSLTLDGFIKYRSAFAKLSGPIRSYQLVKFNSVPERDQITFLFKLEVENTAVDQNEVVRMSLDGSEWKVSHFEVQNGMVGNPTNSNAGANEQGVPLPKGK